MQEVEIKSIELNNFRKFKKFKYDFCKNNKIYGRSGCGKTTIMESWLWTCGIDVDKPYPIDNNTVSTCTKCRISINGSEYVISRRATPKWKNNDGVKEFDGYDSSKFSIDGIEMNTTRFRNEICLLFGINNYGDIRFLCDTNFFNSTRGTTWDWKKRREVLYNMCDLGSKITELQNKECYKDIANELKKGISSTDIIKLLNAEKRNIVSTKERNVILISEKEKDIEEYSSSFDNFDNIKQELDRVLAKRQTLVNEMQNCNKDVEIMKLKKESLEINTKIMEMQLKDGEKKSKLVNLKSKLEMSTEDCKEKLEMLNVEIGNAKLEIENIENSKIDVLTVCPTCGHKISQSKIEETKKEISANNDKRKSYLQELVKADNAEVELAEKTIKDNTKKIAEINKTLENFKEDEKISEYQLVLENNDAEIEKLKESNGEYSSIKEQINTLDKQISKLVEDLSFEKVINVSKAKIEMLKADLINIGNLEIKNAKKRKEIDDYAIETTKLVNDTINDKFNGITWNLFEEYNSSADKEIRETCEAVYNGVLYSQCSNGEKLYIDFLTIKALQNAYGVSLPIFCEECQSSTFERKCKQQLIELETTNIGTNLTQKEIEKYGDK